jgi:hypothetical protein
MFYRKTGTGTGVGLENRHLERVLRVYVEHY